MKEFGIFFIFTMLDLLFNLFANNLYILTIFFVGTLLMFANIFMYFSLRNIFKIFFLTEVILLTVVLFLAQLTVIDPVVFPLNYFYCQLILASAAAEGALFLGLFSYLYDKQFTNRLQVKQRKITFKELIFLYKKNINSNFSKFLDKI